MTETGEKGTTHVDPAEARERWEQQAADARVLLDQFRNVPQELQPAINSGIRQLIRKARPMQPLGESADLTKLGAAIGDCFEESLSFAEMPSGVYAIKGKRDIDFRRNPQSILPSPQLMPKNVAMVIERYGLATGSPVPPAAMAEKYRMLPQAIERNTHLAVFRIINHPGVSAALDQIPRIPLKITFHG
jgi:hypothetical protein